MVDSYLVTPLVNWFDKHFVAVSYTGFVIPFKLGYAFGGINLAFYSTGCLETTPAW